jgi:hypothetical protein
MSVVLIGDVVSLRGDCGIEDVEPLLKIIQKEPKRALDLSQTTHLHAALVQILLVYKAALTGHPTDEFVSTWLVPALKSGHELERS